jgi:hypothetical protein
MIQHPLIWQDYENPPNIIKMENSPVLFMFYLIAQKNNVLICPRIMVYTNQMIFGEK